MAERAARREEVLAAVAPAVTALTRLPPAKAFGRTSVGACPSLARPVRRILDQPVPGKRNPLGKTTQGRPIRVDQAGNYVNASHSIAGNYVSATTAPSWPRRHLCSARTTPAPARWLPSSSAASNACGLVPRRSHSAANQRKTVGSGDDFYSVHVLITPYGPDLTRCHRYPMGVRPEPCLGPHAQATA